ncbi:hypothetical protein M378DRAFT_101656 [Amanita muscaria Koide BX008]|uniref:U6 snRNA phosphodiesterase n=1 Tax=Amanita muscaria (strain Koide BX008) TaxID=946122 RepID=A0A0C2SWS4_AMAMK|nr:hypothetical protein M378DRAFT_101656 [Amanita muscaria Koide BX008]
MKRASLSLVEYDASDEEETQDPAPPPKKRKLPPLSTSLKVPAPIDNPALHQGRVRTHPHVDGQYAAHVYLSLRLKPRNAIYQLLREVISDAKKSVPALQEICKLDEENNGFCKNTELHISLSRPVYLRAHQREDFKREVMQIVKRHKPFPVSFAKFSELVNDEQTRTFLTMEIGAGHHELQSIAVALTPILRSLRQKEYYENPRFHASVAWALLDRGSPQLHVAGTQAEESIFAVEPPDSNAPYPPAHGPGSEDSFPSVPHFPIDLVSRLNELYGEQLISTKVGLFDAEHITVKIGRDTFLWRMVG